MLRSPTKQKSAPAAPPPGSAAAPPPRQGSAGASPPGQASAAAPPAPRPGGAAASSPQPKTKSGALSTSADTPPQPVDPETFAIYMAGVRVLEDRVSRIPITASRIERATPPALLHDPDAEARARMRSLVIEGIRFETTDDGDRIEGRRLDVDPRELRRLRRARYAIDGQLDLHGLRLEEARSAVEAFVRKRQTDGDRVVAIVHGKGNNSPRGYSVLRGEIAAWLTQGRVARHVAAFATAPDSEGGRGAVLVLLSR